MQSEKQTPATAKPDSLSVLLRGEIFSARKLDGKIEEVKIVDLPVSELPKLLACYANESALVELYCQKEKGWSDTIEREDCVKIMERGDFRNLNFFQGYLARQVSRMEVLMPGASAELKSKLDAELKNKTGLPLVNGSPASQ